jgi:hypothetical protein
VEASDAVVPGSSPFLAPELLQQKQKDYLKAAFLQIVGDKTSKPQAEKLLGSSWTKVHEWSASSGEPPEHLADLGLWRQLEGRGPCVVLTSGRGPMGQPAVFGAFWQGKVPSIPEHFEPGSALAHDVDAADGDFCFCYLPGEGIHHHFTSAEDLPLAQIAVEYEGGVGLAIGGSFMLVSYCNGFESCFGYLDEVDEVTVAGVPSPPKGGRSVPEDLSVEATEIWALEPSGSAESQGPSKSSEIESEQTRLTSLTTECRHPWVAPAAPFNLYRATPVYMVPAHLTIRAAVQILLKREGEAGISASFASSPIANLAELTVEQVYEQFLQDQSGAEELNKILDLKYDRQKVLQNTTEIEGLKKLDGPGTDGGESHLEQIAAFYVPQMSFFAQFEAKGGVAKIISVTLASLSLWKSGALAASWSMWLQELHSFSQIPLFFQLFLKHQKCKELLFKVLAGQPDSELQADGGKQAHWAQEQKEAVQINYRILGEVFSVSEGLELREKALACGLLPRILERLAAISGEKPRVFEALEADEAQEDEGALDQALDDSGKK